MFARLRAPLLFLLARIPFSAAADGVLFTSSVTYCEPPESLLVQQFDLKYFNANQSIFFDIAAQSVEANVNVSANILVNVYGLVPINVTIDLCDILAGALCPLPQYNFVGSDSLSLPGALGVAKHLPSIAFVIPDLEAYAQLTLIEVGTGDIKACVQATLSNGWSTRQPPVGWATAALALFTLLVAMWQSTSSYAVVPYRLLDLLHFYQTIAVTGLLGLNYPSLYRAFTLNFAWAMGLVSSAHSKLQTSIDNMRALTGGNMANSSSSSAVGFVDRSLSPWNTGVRLASSSFTQSLLVDTSAASTAPINLTFSRIALGGLRQLASTEGEVQTVTADSSNVLQAGVPIYVNSIHIGSANAFMTVFLICLIILAVALVVSALGYGALCAAAHFAWGTKESRQRLETLYPAYLRAWALRLGLVGLPPITIFAFYQWSLKDSWLSILLSVIAFLAIWALVLHSVFLTLRLVRRESPDELDFNSEHLASRGPLYAQYRTPRYYFFLPLLVGLFIKAVTIAAGERSGMAQVIVFLIVELAVVVAHILLKPYNSRGGDVFSTYLAIARLVCTGLMIAFVESIGVAAIPRVVIGAVIVVIFSIAVLVLAINIFLHSGILWAWRHRRSVRAPSRQGSADASILEKGQDSPIESKTGIATHSRSPSQRSAAVDESTYRNSISTSVISRTVGASTPQYDMAGSRRPSTSSTHH